MDATRLPSRLIDARPDAKPGGVDPAHSPAPRSSYPSDRFASTLSSVRPGTRPSASEPVTYTIREGDTLSGIALTRLKALGRAHAARDVHDAVQALAAANGIKNPDRIFAGEALRLDVLKAPPPAQAGAQPPGRLSSTGRVAQWPAWAPSRAGEPAAALPGARSRYPVLDKTLDRATENGYLPAGEVGAVRDKIIGLAKKYNFSPDDFATVALMESDGLNPKASNGRCFGIIQFCGGPRAGAAAVGLADSAGRIADRPVLEQLDLVDRYFEHNGLQRLPQVGLVDLYLTVLTPAAIRERSDAAPLPIAGTQARALHANRDRSQPITRASILNGLIDHARQLLAHRRVSDPIVARGNESGNSLPLAGQSQRGFPMKGSG